MKNQIDFQMTIIIWMTVIISLGFIGTGLLVQHEAKKLSSTLEVLEEINDSAKSISAYAKKRR